MQIFVGGLLGVPRRCPVDDAPHTTCVAPDYVPMMPGALVVVPVVRPFVLDAMDEARKVPAAAPVDSPTVSAPFTTATYRRPRRRGVRTP